MKTASEYIVAFHIGRGGRFHNPGHKTFNPHIQKLSDCFSESCIVLSEDEDGNALSDDQWQLIDGGSNVILEGRANIESTTGVLDWDGQYDTDIVQYLSDCDESELQILLKEYDYGTFFPYDEEFLHAFMEKWPNALQVVNDDDDIVYIGMDKDSIIEIATSGEDSRVMAEEVTIWESKQGEAKLKSILANY